MIVSYQYIRTYNTNVSMRVKFNLNFMIYRTISWHNSDIRTNITLEVDAPIRQSLVSFLLLLRGLTECHFFVFALIFPAAAGFALSLLLGQAAMWSTITLTFLDKVVTEAARAWYSLLLGQLPQPEPQPQPRWQFLHCRLHLSWPRPCLPWCSPSSQQSSSHAAAWHLWKLVFWAKGNWAHSSCEYSMRGISRLFLQSLQVLRQPGAPLPMLATCSGWLTWWCKTWFVR